MCIYICVYIYICVCVHIYRVKDNRTLASSICTSLEHCSSSETMILPTSAAESLGSAAPRQGESAAFHAVGAKSCTRYLRSTTHDKHTYPHTTNTQTNTD